MQNFQDAQNTKQLNSSNIQKYKKTKLQMRKAARWEKVKVPEKVQHEKSNQIGASLGAKRCTGSGQRVVIWENIVFLAAISKQCKQEEAKNLCKTKR